MRLHQQKALEAYKPDLKGCFGFHMKFSSISSICGIMSVISEKDFCQKHKSCLQCSIYNASRRSKAININGLQVHINKLERRGKVHLFQ